MARVREGEKPLNVDLPEDLHQVIRDHRFDVRAEKVKEAVADLIRRGRAAYLEEAGKEKEASR